MFASSVLFSALASLALVNGAPVARDTSAASPPPGWAYGYLEKYDTYHTRYMALDCQDQHNSDFFDQCCHPLLADEKLSSRPAQCIPTASDSSSAAAVAATETGSTNDDAASEFAAATSTVVSTAAASPSPTPKKAQKQSSNDDNSGSSSSSGGGSGTETGGFATFFYQGGNPGACGNYHSDSDKIVAIDTSGWWQNTGSPSPYCGQWVTITNNNNGKTVVAQIQDACPTCVNGNSLDLSVGAFTAIADESEGSVPITWSFN